MLIILEQRDNKKTTGVIEKLNQPLETIPCSVNFINKPGFNFVANIDVSQSAWRATNEENLISGFWSV